MADSPVVLRQSLRVEGGGGAELHRNKRCVCVNVCLCMHTCGIMGEVINVILGASPAV